MKCTSILNVETQLDTKSIFCCAWVDSKSENIDTKK